MRNHPLEKHATAPSQGTSNPQPTYNAALALLFNRCFTATLSICLLGLTANYVQLERRTDVGLPQGLGFYLACSTISAVATVYCLPLSLPLLREYNPWAEQPHAKIVRKRWTLLGIDSLLFVFWIVAAVVGRGSAPHFVTKGINLTALGVVMALFQSWAIGLVAFAKGFRDIGR